MHHARLLAGLFCFVVAPVFAQRPSDNRLPAAGDEVELWLTVLHNNDADSRLLDASGTPGFGGAARFVGLVRELREKAEDYARKVKSGAPSASILLSGGNSFFVSPEFTASLKKGVPFFDSLVLTAARYDAVALGTHEFSFGPDVLAKFIRGSFPGTRFLSANVDVRKDGGLASLRRQGRIAESTVIRKQGVPIGIVAATTPLLRELSSPGNVEVNANVAAEIQREVRRLQSRKVRIVILLSNLPNLGRQQDLIKQLSGVDLVVAGGSTEVLANPGNRLIPGDQKAGPYPILARDRDRRQVPLVTTGGRYLYLGRLIVGFNKNGELAAMDCVTSGPVRVGDELSGRVVREARDVARRIVQVLRSRLATLDAEIAGRLQTVLDGARASLRVRETNLGDLVADAILAEARDTAPKFRVRLPAIAIINSGAITTDRPVRNTIRQLEIFSILGFPDFITVVEGVSAATLKEILEDAVSQVEQQGGRFPQISGFSFTFDPRRQAQRLNEGGNVTRIGRRIRKIRLDDGTAIVTNGQLVPGAPALDVATIDFLALGGDQYPFPRTRATTLGVTYQQALANLLKRLRTVRPADYPPGGLGRIVRQN